MKKSETIALYLEAYMEGKDEIDRRNFFEKSEDKQYAAIMAWKRRRNESKKSKEEVTGASILDMLTKATKAFDQLNDLSQKDAEKMMPLIDQLTYNVINFDLIKKGRRLKELRSQRSSLDREIEMLENEGVKEC